MTTAVRNGHTLAHPPIVEGAIVILPFSQVEHDPHNDREDWESREAREKIYNLAHGTFQTSGFITRFAPAVVQIAANKYRVRDGNRRFAAMQLLYHEQQPLPRGPGQEPYPIGFGPFTIISGTEQALNLQALAANSVRSDLNLLETAQAYAKILKSGVPFKVGEDIIYATLTDDEITLVISMTTVLPADIKARLSIPSTFRHPFLKDLMVYTIVKQLLESVSGVTKIEALIKRLSLLNLIDEVRHLVKKGQLTLDFAEALAPLDRNHQFMAFEKWGVASGKMDLRTWQAMCLALAEDQASGAQMTFDNDFWQIQAVESITDPRRKRKGRRYGLDADEKMLAALDEVDLTRGLSTTGTALSVLAEKLKQQGHGDFARYVNAVNEKLLATYYTNPPDTATVLAHMQKEE